MGEVRRGDESNEAEAETNYFVAVAGALTLPPITQPPVAPAKKQHVRVYVLCISPGSRAQDP